MTAKSNKVVRVASTNQKKTNDGHEVVSSSGIQVDFPMLPDADEIKKLFGINEVVGNKFVDAFIAENEHRRAQEKKQLEIEEIAVKSSITIAKRGQIWSGLLSIVGLVCAVLCAYLGKEWAAVTCAGFSITGGIYSFLKSKSKQ